MLVTYGQFLHDFMILWTSPVILVPSLRLGSPKLSWSNPPPCSLHLNKLVALSRVFSSCAISVSLSGMEAEQRRLCRMQECLNLRSDTVCSFLSLLC